MILVSACLCGINCRYDGKANPCDEAIRLLKDNKAIPVCPEQLGGLSTPREPSEISGGTAEDVINGNARIINIKGEDVTKEFLKGASQVLKIALETRCTKAILKAKSPSCGCGKIYNGEFTKTIINGNGLTAELLIRNGIEVITELDL